MREFGAAFDSLRAEEFIPEVFATIRLDFPAPTGTLYFSGGRTSVLGQAHEPIVTRFGEIASMANREEQVLDVSAVRIEFNNFPVLSTGERLSDVFDVSLETVLGRIYLNLVDADGNVSQEEFFRGIVQSPIQYDYERATLTLRALHEAYLNKSALRVARREDFSGMRDAHVGATFPIVIGNVERTPGRVVKASSTSKPQADPDNTGSAQLLDFIADDDAISQDWTVEITGVAVPQEQRSTSGMAEIGGAETTVALGTIQSASTAGTPDTTLGWTHTIAGTDRKIFVIIAYQTTSGAPQTTETVTCGGVAMSLEYGSLAATASGPNRRIALYSLVDPATASPAAIAVTLGAAAHIHGFSYAATGAGDSRTNGNQNGTGATSTNQTAGFPRSTGVKIVGVLFKTNTAAATPATGYTKDAETTSGSTYAAVATADSSAGTTGYNYFTWTGAADYIFLPFRIYQRKTVRAQSFTVPTTQVMTGVKLRMARNPAAPDETRRDEVELQVQSGTAGEPGGTILSKVRLNITHQTAPHEVIFRLPTRLSVTTGNTYWFTLTGVARDSAFTSGGTEHNAAPVTVAFNSGGGYSGGKAQHGVYDHNSEGHLPSGTTGIRWIDDVSGQDLWFEILFEENSYELRGSVTGFDGAGGTTSDFTSDSGQITLLASHWQGIAASGDRFYFSVDASENAVILSESPSDTPVSEIGTVYWNDVPILAGSIEQTTDDEGRDLGKSEDNFAIRHGQSVTIAGGGLYKGGELKLSKTGAPTNGINVQIVRLIGAVPETNALGSASIAASAFTATAAFAGFTFDEPVALADGVYLLTWETEGNDSANYYTTRRTTSDAYTGGSFYTWDGDAQKWISIAGGAFGDKDACFKLTAATLNKYESTDDGTGENVAKVGFDVNIPDEVEITADVIGITDDSSGTYTGIAGALVTTPADVFYWLLIRAGVTAAEIDLDDSFEDTKAHHGGLYRFDGTIQDNETWKKLLLRLAFECRCAFDWPIDKAELKFLLSRITTADETIAFVDIVGPRPEIRVSRSDTTKLVNFVDIRYERQHRFARDLTSYQRIVNALNSASITLFGQRENPEMFFCDFVRSEPMATDLAAYYANRLSNPRRIVEATTKLPFLHVEKDDSVDFNLVK